MNKKDFAVLFAEKYSTSQSEANQQVTNVLELVKELLSKGEEIVFTGFGKFHVKDTAAQQKRNPKTGVAVAVPPKRTAKFKAGSELKWKIEPKKKK